MFLADVIGKIFPKQRLVNQGNYLIKLSSVQLNAPPVSCTKEVQRDCIIGVPQVKIVCTPEPDQTSYLVGCLDKSSYLVPLTLFKEIKSFVRDGTQFPMHKSLILRVNICLFKEQMLSVWSSLCLRVGFGYQKKSNNNLLNGGKTRRCFQLTYADIIGLSHYIMHTLIKNSVGAEFYNTLSCEIAHLSQNV